MNQDRQRAAGGERKSAFATIAGLDEAFLRVVKRHMDEIAMEPPPRYCYCAMASNSSRSYLFKAALQDLAVELGIDIRVAHYPPYTSKLPETA